MAKITVSEQLPSVPAELSSNFVDNSPLEVTPRKPRVGDWVNFFEPEQNGNAGWRRGVNGPFLGRIISVHENGCNVQFWNKTRQAFTSEGGLPWCCIISRAAVSAYSLAA